MIIITLLGIDWEQLGYCPLEEVRIPYGVRYARIESKNFDSLISAAKKILDEDHEHVILTLDFTKIKDNISYSVLANILPSEASLTDSEDNFSPKPGEQHGIVIRDKTGVLRDKNGNIIVEGNLSTVGI